MLKHTFFYFIYSKVHITQKDVLEKVLQNGKSGKVSGIDLEKKKVSWIPFGCI